MDNIKEDTVREMIENSGVDTTGIPASKLNDLLMKLTNRSRRDAICPRCEKKSTVFAYGDNTDVIIRFCKKCKDWLTDATQGVDPQVWDEGIYEESCGMKVSEIVEPYPEYSDAVLVEAYEDEISREDLN